ncbi:PriCT-2 domain-containing protein [Tepidimonas taiwanensis]|uniref:DNA primase TraC n=1 Tax=Tepidimonas taiwanensis TaxID=307486 RepID=A0A554X0F5_9BURK|nr:PriCT-2 domain-containing protein [Tepidimonas taiwanensis]TSE29337.1 DNA primase TraC [Tepidimonas taiwanensis]UBQ06507.1 PriCT-2 domain-containing protein [Tepidimonas taiwanensis]
MITMGTDPAERIRSALACIDPHDRQTWVRMAMGIKEALGDDGFDIWNSWSAGASNYDPRAARDTWRSIRCSGGVTVASLFHEAKRNGWRGDAAMPSVPARPRTAPTAQHDAEREAKAQRAREVAARVWDAARPAGADHPYLVRKRVQPTETLGELDADRLAELTGYRAQSGGELLQGPILIAPVRVGGELSSVEFIDELGRKAALSGGRKRGGIWATGPLPEAGRLVLAEGVATALSIAEALGEVVAAALSVNNLKAAGEAIRAERPGLELVIAADLSEGGQPHPEAVKAARALGCGIVAPPAELGERADFNDLHVARGLDAVREAFEHVERPEPEPSDDGHDPAKADPDPAEAVAHLLELARAGDPAAFWRACRGSTLDALRDLRDRDPGGYQALRVELKAACPKIGVTALDKLLRSEEADGAPQSQATTLAELAAERCTLWHDPDGEAFASFAGSAGEVQHWRIDSTGFRDWLAHLAFTELGAAPGSEALKAATTALSGKAKFEGEEHTPALRVAKTDEGYWLDIGDPRWRAILLTPGGWRIVEHPPVRFLRSKATRAMPEPAARGDVGLLWNLVNVPEADRLLVLAWLLECWRADTPYAVLELSGEQGAAKSTAQRILRGFVDPSDVPLRGRPKTTEDLYVAAANAHLLSFENLSTLSADQSDAMCAISTGAGFAARRLYTDSEEAVLKAHRPIAVNGINPVITRPDLLDRAVCIHLPRLAQRRTDEQIREATERDAPTIFAGLLDLFCNALRVLPEVKRESWALPRLADFAQLGEAIARVLGHKPGHFLELYAGHRRQSIQRTIDASPVAMAIVKMVEAGRSFRGSVGELLDLLNRDRPAHEASDYWPRSPRGLGDALRRYSPALGQLGIKVEVESHTRSVGRVMCEIGRMAYPFFAAPQQVGNNVTDVTDVTKNGASGDVGDIGDIDSMCGTREKGIYPAGGNVTATGGDVVEVDL